MYLDRVKKNKRKTSNKKSREKKKQKKLKKSKTKNKLEKKSDWWLGSRDSSYNAENSRVKP